jgi:hypothetical protein
MSEVMIEGWTCTVANGDRCARREGPDMLASYNHADRLGLLSLSETNCDVPPAVLAWLIRPLLHEAWAEGASLRPNPYTDNTPSEEG